MEKRDILSLYRSDISKIDRNYRSKVLSIFDQIPGFLSQHEKRVRLSSIEEKSTFPMYEETFFWLTNALIAPILISDCPSTKKELLSNVIWATRVCL